MAAPRRRRHDGGVSFARAAVLSFAVLAACRLGGSVEPIALRGPAPASILVWPIAAADPDLPQLVLRAGLDVAVQRRGYRVLTSAVAAQMLADAGVQPDPTDVAAIRDATGADAVLRLVVQRLEVEGERLQRADWDVAWELTSTVTGARLWEYAHVGHWDRRAPVEVHPLPREDEAPPVLFGDRRPDFRDASDLMVWLHRFALEHLPRGSA